MARPRYTPRRQRGTVAIGCIGTRLNDGRGVALTPNLGTPHYGRGVALTPNLGTPNDGHGVAPNLGTPHYDEEWSS